MYIQCKKILDLKLEPMRKQESHFGRGTSPKGSFGFDPEGLVTTLSAVFPMFVGLHVGRAGALDLKASLLHWLLLAALLAVLGLSLSYFVAFNKRLWSPSYNFFTAGTGICLYTMLYVVCDVEWSLFRRLRQGTVLLLKPFQWLGCNAIFFFVFSECCGLLSWMLQCVTWGSGRNLVRCFRDFLWHSLGRQCNTELCGPVEVAYTAIQLMFWILLCGLLYRKGLFWKI